MKIYKLQNFKRGWFIGNFSPALVKSKDFEVGIKCYTKGDEEQKHLHKIADEYSVVLNGEFLMNGKKIKSGDIVHIKPGEPAKFSCLKDGMNIVIKIPSVKNDKFILK